MWTVTRVLIALSVVAVLYVMTRSPIGDLVDRWETQQGSLKIRIDQRAEDLWFVGLPGGYYVFQASHKNAPWRDVMIFRHDDPVPIPHDNVHFVDERIAFVFMGWMYAVTTDGGQNWSVWNAETDLRDWNCCDYKLIKQVDLSADGTGRMSITARGSLTETEPNGFRLLVTKDFGKHWAAPPG